MKEKRPNAGQPPIDLKERAQLNKSKLQDEYFTIQELADILKVHERTIRNNIKNGKIKAVKICKNWRIKKEDIL